MRRFTILHLSDLHLANPPNEESDVLYHGVIDAIEDSPKPRILVITGDLVDSPTSSALAAARNFIRKFGELAECTYIIPGNHDVNRFLGSFSQSEEFNKTFETGPDMLLKEVGLHLIGLDSTSAAFARGEVNPGEYDKLVRQYYQAEKQSGSISDEEQAGLLRLVAVHHHPLPLAEGEGQKILGVVKDEGLMYLESPAQMLEACIDCNVSLILHGHRHVQGLVRYSVQSSEFITSYVYGYDDSWQTIYVLSCPSSTGKDCEAGFNVLEFNLSSEGAFVDIGRYSRKRNQSLFELIDGKRPNRKVRLTFSKQLVRDVAVDVEAALSRLPNEEPPETEFFPIVSELFRRRAFMPLTERHWGQLFYAILKTRLVWQMQVLKRLRSPRQEAGEAVLYTLIELEEFVAYKVLELAPHEPDDLRVKFINDKASFLHALPSGPSDLNQCEGLESKREKILNKLKDHLAECRIPTNGFGKVPFGYSGDE